MDNDEALEVSGIDSIELALSRGFDAGNYANAYTCDDWDTWWAEHAEDCASLSGEIRQAFQAGCLLGFFSSYELEEIPSDVEPEIEQLRQQYPQL